MEYQVLTKKYAPSAAFLEATYLDTAWSEKQIEESIQRDDTYYLIAVENNNLFATASCVFSLYEGMIENVAVAESHRQMGIGTELLALIETEARRRKVEQLSLEVASRNKAAIALYMRAGFAKAGVRKGFYRKQNDDALVMIKEIS